MEKYPKAVEAFLEYIYTAFYQQVAEVRAYITPDMWAVQEMLNAHDLTEQRMLREAQAKLKGAWKRDSDNPKSFENFVKELYKSDKSEEVSDSACSVRSEKARTDEADCGHSESELLQDSGQGSD